MLPKDLQANIQAVATISQYLAKDTWCSTQSQVSLSPLLDYAWGFKATFAKKDFDTLPEHQK